MDRAIGLAAQGGQYGVVFVIDFADNLFQDVFQSHQTLQGAIFIDHQGEMSLLLEEGGQLILQVAGVGDEPWLAHDGHDVDTLDVALGADHRRHQVAGMEHTDDVLGIVLVQRDAGVAEA